MSSPEIAIKVTADTSQAQASIQSLNTAMVQAGTSTSGAFGPGISNARVLRASFGEAATSTLQFTRTAVSGVQGLVGSINGLYDAQQRVNVATISYTLTVREYGAGSIQAARALDQLKVAQNGVGLAQLNLNLQYLQFALSVGPQLYATLQKIIAASLGVTLQNYVETASWYQKAAAIALTLGILTAGVAVAGGVAASAMVNNQITQNNNFFGVGQQNPSSVAASAHQQLTSIYKP